MKIMNKLLVALIAVLAISSNASAGGWNGSGTFSRSHNWQQDQINGIAIRADRMDEDSNDFASGINDCVTKDGQNQATANLPMGGFIHTGVGVATARNQYYTLGQAQDSSATYFTSSGSSNAYILTPSPVITTYTAGQRFYVKASFTNTGTATININALGAKNLTKNGTSSLNSGDLVTGTIYEIEYDGTEFQILNTLVDLNPSVTTLTATTSITTPLISAVLIKNLATIQDSNNLDQIIFNATSSAVNYFGVTNAATGAGPLLSATGSDTNIDFDFSAKGTGAGIILGTSTAPATLKFREQTTNGTNIIGLQAPASVASDVTFVLPPADGSSGQVLKTDGSKNLSFVSIPTTLFTASYTSADQSITYGTAVSLTHGLGAVPKIVNLYMVCQTADGGYSPGDIIQISPGDDNTTGLALYSTSTNITYRFSAAAFAYPQKTSGNGFNPVAANWKVRVIAYE